MKHIEITLTAEQQEQLNNVTLESFLASFGAKESSIHEILKDDAEAAVKQNGYALQYVNEQTVSICEAAVKQNGDALQYVKKATFEAVKIILIAGAKYAIEQIK